MFDRLNTLFASVTSRLYAQEEGQAMVEYALILVVVAAAAVAIFSTIGGGISSKLSDIAAQI